MVKPKLELTEADARRLAFAQHLIMRAHEDARLPSPLNAAAVLSAQDAVEMVLIRNGSNCYFPSARSRSEQVSIHGLLGSVC